MKKLSLYIAILAGLLLFGCAEDEATTFGGISGVVKDKVTAEALSGVRVSIMPGGDSSVTGEDGNFQFKDLEAADYTVSFMKEGYASDSKKVTVSPGMNRDASVTLEPIVPALSVSPLKLDFGSETTTLALDIKNTGKGSLQWSISEELGWLSCLPASGSTTNNTSSVVVTVSRNGLERGNYKGTIVVSSNGGSQTVPVSLSVEDVKLEVSPVVLDYGTTETSLQLTLRNTGSGTINYTVTSSNSWLTPNKKSGSVTQTDYVTAVVSREGLSAGKYDATLEFTTDRGNVVVPVHMEVTDIVPVLSVSPARLDFGNETTTLAIDIKNTGKGLLQWSVSEDLEWLSCLPASGETTNETSSVVVTVLRNGLEPKNYNGTIVVSSNGGSQTVPVSLSVEAVKLEVSPASLDYGTSETSLQLTLRNGGSGTINYTVTSSNNWLVPNKKSGSVTQTDYVRAVVSREGLSAGKYDATLEFKTDGGNVVVPVKMEVAAAAAPTVAIESASNATYNSVQLRGTVLSVGSAKITRHGFCWSEHTGPTVEDACSDAGDCSEPKSFESIISNLKSSTTYYVRAYAINDVGIAYSERELTFSTTATPTVPAVRTGSIDNITDASARISGSITALGNVAEITHYGHVWSKMSQPTLQNADQTDYGKTASTRSYTSDLTGLAANTTYYVRAYAVNEVGTAYGDEVAFTTQKAAPVIETSEIGNIGYSSAVGGGAVLNANGHSIVEKGLCWNTTGSPDMAGPHAIADASFVCSLTGLTASTTYYVRAYVKTSENLVYYGNQRQFTTIAAPVNPTNGLFAYYTFENNSKNMVEGASNGQLVNSPTYVEGVQGSNALKFSASNNGYMFVPAQDMISGSSFTISFWAKNISDGHLFHTTRTRGYNDSYGDNATGLYMSGGRLRFIVTGYSTYYEYSYDKYYFSHGTLDSNWHMITLVTTVGTPQYAYAQTRLYIDGEFMSSVSEYAGNNSASYKDTIQFIIGGKLDYYNLKVNAVSMSIDNLRIYNTRALSDTEVKQIYNYEK